MKLLLFFISVILFSANFSAISQTCLPNGAYYVNSLTSGTNFGPNICVNSSSIFLAAFTPNMQQWIPLGSQFNYSFSINVPGTVSPVTHTSLGPQVSIIFSTTGPAIVRLVISDNCGNVKTVQNSNIIITNQQPSNLTFSSSSSNNACTSNPVTLSVSGQRMSSVRWRCAGQFDLYTYNNSPSGTSLSRSVVFTTAGVKTVFADISNGCGTVTLSTTINVTQSPADFVIASSGADKVCSGTTQVFSVPNEPGVSYQWGFSQGGGIIQSNSGNSISILWNQANTTVIALSASRGACVKTAQKIVQIVAPSTSPPALDTRTEFGVCLGFRSFSVLAKASEKDFDWTISGGGYILSKFQQGGLQYLNVYWEQAGCHTVTCSATDYCGNTRTSSKLVCVGASGQPIDPIVATLSTSATANSITVTAGQLTSPQPHWFTTCGYVNKDPSCLSRKVLITASSNSNSNSTPIDQVHYIANSVFGAGSDLGNGNFVVYSGLVSSFSGVVIQGLNCGTMYHLAAFEYDEPTCGNGPNYVQIPIRRSHSTSPSPVYLYIENNDYCTNGSVGLVLFPTSGYSYVWVNGGPIVSSSGYYSVNYAANGCTGTVGTYVDIDWNSCNSNGGGNEGGGGCIICPRTRLETEAPETEIDGLEMEQGIYPNPSQREVWVVLDQISQFDRTVSVTDLSGKRMTNFVFKRGKKRELFNIELLPEGIYMLNFNSANGNKQMKMVITR
jgi:hypothetical protein